MKMLAKVIDHQTKQITYNCYTFFKKRKNTPGTREHQHDINIIDVCAQATGLSKTTVTRIIREGNKLLNENPSQPVIFPAQAKVKHVRAKRISFNEQTQCILRRKVIQYYSSSNEVPSVRKLNALLKKDKILNCSDEYLRKLLHKLGFTNSDGESSGRFKESTVIVKERHDYLAAIKDFRDKGKSIFFLNETKRWDDEDGIKDDMPCIIMVHASGSEGFADGSTVMINIKQSADLDKNFQHFHNYDWMKDTVIPNLPSSAVIVLNMPECESHTAIESDPKPHEAGTRASMENWLKRHNIDFQETDCKATLVKHIADVESNMKYSLTKLLEENEYPILYLPQKFQGLNPAAVMWDEVKNEAKKSSAADVILNYSDEAWQKCFKKVEACEYEYYNHDSKVDLSSVKIEKDVEIEIKTESPETESDMEQDSEDGSESSLHV